MGNLAWADGREARPFVRSLGVVGSSGGGNRIWQIAPSSSSSSPPIHLALSSAHSTHFPVLFIISLSFSPPTERPRPRNVPFTLFSHFSFLLSPSFRPRRRLRKRKTSFCVRSKGGVVFRPLYSTQRTFHLLLNSYFLSIRFEQKRVFWL